MAPAPAVDTPPASAGGDGMIRPMETVTIPTDLLPADGRFGCGPSKVRPAQVDMLAALGTTLLGTSHRQAPVRSLVRRVREGVAALLGAPEGYEVVLGNGGSTAFWDAATFSLVRERAQHADFGEFGHKFATATDRAPFLAASDIRAAAAGTLARCEVADGVDVYAYPQNETSTGVLSPVERVAADDALTVVDATSAAGGVAVDLAETDVYYFAPRRTSPPTAGCGSPSSPPPRWRGWRSSPRPGGCRTSSTSSWRWTTRARTRPSTRRPSPRWCCWPSRWTGSTRTAGSPGPPRAPPSRPGSSTTGPRPTRSTTPFVADPAHRSPVVGTIDVADTVDATALAATLRANGVVDVEPYRKLGRNQLRVGMFPAVDPADVRALTACVDYVVERLG